MTTPSTDASAAAPLASGSDALRGRFLWYDLMTPDVDAAVAFYTAVTSWGTTKWEMAEGMPPYIMWTKGETPIGGTMGLPAEETARGTPAHWLVYIGTPDCDATYAQALALGATSRTAPRDIPTVGRYAVLTDPQGALFALYTPSTVPDAPSAPVPGDMVWHELITTDRPAGFGFHQQLFGWESMQEMDMGPGGIYQIFGQGGVQLGGVYDQRPDDPAAWQLYVYVADLEVALDAVRANGGEIVRGPNPVPGSRVVECRDPQGGAFAMSAADTGQ